VTEHAALPANIQRFVAVLATGFVLFTLFINGTSLRVAIRLLGVDRLSPRDAALRDRIQALSYAEARDAAREIARVHALSQAALERVIAPYQARLDAAQAEQDATARNLSEADQLTIALVSLANQERVLIIEIVRAGMLSPGVAQALLSNTEALAEAARSDGRVGYESASDDTFGHRFGFHVALFLYRRFGLVRMLADRLAERLEILLIMRIALGRLAMFNSQIAKLFGEPIAVITREIVSRRQQAIENALDVLRRQYPDYLTELEVRFLTQSTLHHEMNRYQSLFEEGLISHELYEDLKRNTLRAESSFRRPHFDIGLDTQELVKRLDLLASLDERQLEIVCGLLRPRFAVPHERIIRKGDRGDRVYFIASGTVEVILPDRRIQIGAGAFFGEMALLSGRLRQADVVAVTYCQLLVLRQSDFEQFMRENPDARAAIVRVAKARQLTNTRKTE
jgi:monovalent cation:H+ antiporter, CPA1 family